MNRKGFTMVELLAALVILGLLSTLAITTITRTIDKGRNKTYIADASNMVAQAEYLVKSKPAEIGRPPTGGCIVIYLSYFNSDDFKSAPNGGEYDPDKSFVVYKNTGSGYEFAGMLIEKMKKGGFKGVQLGKAIDLSKGKGDIVGIDSAHTADIDASHVQTYINNHLGSGYCNNTLSTIKQ